MKTILSILALTVYLSFNSFGQSLDSLKLSAPEVPEGYSVCKRNNCISIQACTFYENPEMYEMIIGKLKKKEIQSFESKKDNGSIMYFEFENEFKGAGFLGGLLWGGKKPTKENPEEFYTKGNFLIIWSFNKGSNIKILSEKKVKAIL